MFGPGNAWVTAAKLLVANDPDGAALDLPAGPSEVLVIADDTARAEFVAADLLAQAEHSADAQAMLVTTSRELAAATRASSSSADARLGARAHAARIDRSSRIFVVASLETAFEVSNRLRTRASHRAGRRMRAHWLPQIRNAGSVFLGAWTPETMGDYCSGTNHVLPTYGFARAYSGLSLTDFLKRMTVQELTAEGLRDLGPTAITLAELEGLDAHANAVQVRLAQSRRRKPHDEQDTRTRASRHPDAAALSARGLGAVARAHARQRNAVACDGDAPGAGLNRYPEPQPAELVDASGDSSTASRRERCSSAAAATKASICWCAPSVAPARTACSSARRRSACTRCRRASRAPASSKCRCSRSGALRSMCERCSQHGATASSWCSCARRTIPPATCSIAAPSSALSRAGGTRVVVVDEAYIEFARDAEHDRHCSSAFRTWSCCARCRRPMRWPARAAARCSRTPNRRACSRA